MGPLPSQTTTAIEFSGLRERINSIVRSRVETGVLGETAYRATKVCSFVLFFLFFSPCKLHQRLTNYPENNERTVSRPCNKYSRSVYRRSRETIQRFQVRRTLYDLAKIKRLWRTCVLRLCMGHCERWSLYYSS